MSNTFEVVFSGEVLDGFDPAETRAKIGKLFNADEAKIVKLFSGNSVVIKKSLDQATANKYVAAFKNAGARAVARDTAETEVEEIQAAAPPAEPAATAPKPAPAAPTSSATVNPDAFEYNSTAAAPPAPKTQVDLNANPDLSGLTMRENTGNLVDPSEDMPEPQIDISGLTVASVGTELSDNKDEQEEYNPDLSGITLADN